MQTSVKIRKHLWIVTLLGTLAALVMLIHVPEKKEYSLVIIGLAGGHLIIGILAIFTGWILIPLKWFQFGGGKHNSLNFGYNLKWTFSFVIVAFLLVMLAIHLFFSLEGLPVIQLIIYSFSLLLAVNLFIGFLIIINSKKQLQLVLPMVSLLPNNKGTILDAGCGAGRTAIAAAKAYTEAKIIALDKFDADYIEGGGADLIRSNMILAGISNKVEVIHGDITASPFAVNEFDGIISSYMFDHLGRNKQKALQETYRILKPGGRFLLIIMVRSYTLFGLASFLSLFFPTRNDWLKMIRQTGFHLADHGRINEGTFFLLQK